jgi:hypothetical protein
MEYNNNNLNSDQINIIDNHSDIISEVNTCDNNLRKRLKPYFSSNYNGTYITNAETGELYPDIVGSKNEKKYFRVIDSTGVINEKGQPNFGIKNSNKLFYTNVEQYINHRNWKYNKTNNVNNI